MADLATLDKAFHHIMQSFIETGRAPHYAETGGCTRSLGRRRDDSSFTISKRRAIRSFSIPRPTRSSPLLRLTTCPTNTALPSMGSRNGSPSEGLKRWRFAG